MWATSPLPDAEDMTQLLHRIGGLSAPDLTALQQVRDRADADTPLQVEMRGDLVWAFAEPETGGEVVGLVAALVILLVAFGSVVAAGIPIAVALTGLATAVGGMTL